METNKQIAVSKPISTVAVLGLGLIGGSMALVLKNKGLAQKIIGVDNNEKHCAKAMELHLVDEINTLENALATCQLLIIAIPVDAAVNLLPQIMPLINQQVVMDVGSTKHNICNAANSLPNRGRFVATHPMWGTEYSGPEAALADAFTNKAVVICNQFESDTDAIDLVTNLYTQMGMHPLQMEAMAHDLHAAYVSHISHITSFALANTVLEKEKEDNAIFELASGGFESTVRLAKSNAAMWVPIFKQNKENVLDVLNEHITQLRKFKSCLEKENDEYLLELILQANQIKRIIQ